MNKIRAYKLRTKDMILLRQTKCSVQGGFAQYGIGRRFWLIWESENALLTNNPQKIVGLGDID